MKLVSKLITNANRNLHFQMDHNYYVFYFAQVDIAFITVIERVQPLLEDAFKYDITLGRPKLATWIKVYITVIYIHAHTH